MLVPFQCEYLLWVRFEAEAEREWRTEMVVRSGSEDMNNEAGKKNTPPIPICPALKVEETNDYY